MNAQQRYRLNNKDKIRERSRKYYEKNKAIINERCQNYRINNIEKEKERYRLYRQPHLIRMDEMKEYMGGCCDVCKHNVLRHLEFAHVDPSQKSQNISTMYSATDQEFCEETSKCHLLCRNCHYDETQQQRGDGTIWKGIGESRKRTTYIHALGDNGDIEGTGSANVSGRGQIHGGD